LEATILSFTFSTLLLLSLSPSLSSLSFACFEGEGQKGRQSLQRRLLLVSDEEPSSGKEGVSEKRGRREKNKAPVARPGGKESESPPLASPFLCQTPLPLYSVGG